MDKISIYEQSNICIEIMLDSFLFLVLTLSIVFFTSKLNDTTKMQSCHSLLKVPKE